MAYACCLIGVAPENVSRLTVALGSALTDTDPTIALLDVPDIAMLNRAAPDLLVLDVDQLKTDALEALRQLRFVLPDCVVVVYAGGAVGSFARACHNAGANCVLSKFSNEAQVTAGLRHALRTGCFTDAHYTSA